MRARIVLLAALSLLVTRSVHADDFDDDFARAPVDTPPASLSEPHPAQARSPRPAPYASNTLLGPVGGVHAVDARSGPPGTFRIGASARFFRKNGFLRPQDRHRRVGGALSLSATPIEHLELAASLTTDSTESTGETRAVYQTVGDTRLFAKGYFALSPSVTAGADVEVALLNGVGGIGIQGRATSVGLRGHASADLRDLSHPVPLQLRASLRYYFDNSARLIEDTERARYASLGDPTPPIDEVRQLISNTERAAFEINRVDSLTLDLGVEAPLRVAEGLFLSPIAEWSLGVPSNRQGYDCVVQQGPSDPDSCLKAEGVAAWPRTFTLGLRVQPWLRGLSALLAVDVATGGHRRFVRELAPNATYDVIFALGYAYDTHPSPPVESTKTVLVTGEPERRGHILGELVDQVTGRGVPHAIVHFVGRDLSAIAADAAGKFVSYALEQGTYPLHISAPGYNEADCNAGLASPGVDQITRCELTPIPQRGRLQGSVHGVDDAPIAGAKVHISGPGETVLTTDATGQFGVDDLALGNYQAQVEAKDYLMRRVGFEILLDEVSRPLIVLTPKPARPLAALEAKSIAIKRQVQFVTNSADIRDESDTLLAEIADVLLRNPQIRHVEIQGHTDDRGSTELNQDLSQRRAEAVRTWLISAGIDGSRITAVGYGRSRPLSPNITSANRARNRRVAFEIVEQP